MKEADQRLLRISLVIVWWATAIVSLWEFHGQSQHLLTEAGIPSGVLSRVLIATGAAADLIIGLALAFWPTRRVYQLALLLMTAMTVIATLLTPSLWLHPLGPLTKNLPIAAILWLLIRTTK